MSWGVMASAMVSETVGGGLGGRNPRSMRSLVRAAMGTGIRFGVTATSML